MCCAVPRTFLPSSLHRPVWKPCPCCHIHPSIRGAVRFACTARCVGASSAVVYGGPRPVACALPLRGRVPCREHFDNLDCASGTKPLDPCRQSLSDMYRQVRRSVVQTGAAAAAAPGGGAAGGAPGTSGAMPPLDLARVNTQRGGGVDADGTAVSSWTPDHSLLPLRSPGLARAQEKQGACVCSMAVPVVPGCLSTSVYISWFTDPHAWRPAACALVQRLPLFILLASGVPEGQGTAVTFLSYVTGQTKACATVDFCKPLNSQLCACVCCACRRAPERAAAHQGAPHGLNP